MNIESQLETLSKCFYMRNENQINELSPIKVKLNSLIENKKV